MTDTDGMPTTIFDRHQRTAIGLYEEAMLAGRVDDGDWSYLVGYFPNVQFAQVWLWERVADGPTRREWHDELATDGHAPSLVELIDAYWTEVTGRNGAYWVARIPGERGLLLFDETREAQP